MDESAGPLIFLFCILFPCGGVLLGVGIYLAVTTADLSIGNVEMPGTPNQGIWAAAVNIGISVGAVSFIAVFLGVIKNGRPISYILVGIVILLEIVTGTLSLVFNSQITNTMEINMKSSIQSSYMDPNAISSNATDQTSYKWNLAQSKWKCCGSTSYRDYISSDFTNLTGYVVPYECCKRKVGTSNSNLANADVANYSACQSEASQQSGSTKYLYSSGCYWKVKDWVHLNSNILGGLGLSFAGLKVIFAVILMRNM